MIVFARSAVVQLALDYIVKAEDIYTAVEWESTYQNRYSHGSRSRGPAESAIYTAAGRQHKIAFYTAAVLKSIQI